VRYDWGVSGPLALAAALALSALAHESWAGLPVGNGFAAAVYDTGLARVTSLRDHVYARPSTDTLTREWLGEIFFGLRAGGANAWASELAVIDADVWGDTGVVRVEQGFGDLHLTQYFFVSFAADQPHLCALAVATNRGTTPLADAAIFAFVDARVGAGADGTEGEQIVWSEGAFEERGPAGLALLGPLAPPTRHGASPEDPYARVAAGERLVDVDDSGPGDDVTAGLEWDLAGLAAGTSRTVGFVLAVRADGDRAAAAAGLVALTGRTAAEVLADAAADWAGFGARVREPDGLSAAERRVYRRSLALLRMAQVREPATATTRPTGQIVASLLPGMRNTTVVRDHVSSVRALVRAGLLAEAQSGLEFLLGASAGVYAADVGEPYALSVHGYTGDGVEAGGGGPDGALLGIDGWGLALGALAEYVEAAGDDALVLGHAGAVFDRTADVLYRRVDVDDTYLLRADSSIWDGARRKHTFTQAAAVWGLRGAAHLATRVGDTRAEQYAAVADLYADAIALRLVDPSTHVLRSSREETAAFLDGAVVEAFTWDVLPPDGEVALATLAALRAGLWLPATERGYRRSDDGAAADERESVLVDLFLATAARRAGDAAHADELMAWVTTQADANAGLIPDSFHPESADFVAPGPVVGLGAGAYVLALWARADAAGEATAPPADCGCRLLRPAALGPGWLLVAALAGLALVRARGRARVALPSWPVDGCLTAHRRLYNGRSARARRSSR
jgi:GH15 family glucan-1,4-alpha-glucosidase